MTFDDEAAWGMQIVRWREQITELIEEFVSGDVRLRISGASEADGAYAPLTRIKAFLS
jgi:hypothetical protein